MCYWYIYFYIDCICKHIFETSYIDILVICFILICFIYNLTVKPILLLLLSLIIIIIIVIIIYIYIVSFMCLIDWWLLLLYV